MIAVGKRSGLGMKKSDFRRLIPVLGGLVFASGARGAEVFAPEQAGMGGAGVARTDSSGFRNAAAMMLEPGFYSFTEVDWGHGWGVGEAVREVRLDGSVGASMGYHRSQSNLPPSPGEMPGWIEPGVELLNPKVTHGLYGAGGIRMLQGNLAAGGSVRYLRRNSELGGEEADFNLDVSAAGRLAEGVVLAASGRHLIPEGDAPMRMELGLYWSALPNFLLALDGGLEDGEALAAAGVDLGLAEVLRVRGGYRFQGEEQRLGLGLGLLGEGTRLDYAVEIATAGAEDGVLSHRIALFVAVPSQ